MRTRVGLGYDVHAFGGDGPLVLGGVVIEGTGLLGHSDADAVTHAVADAVLSAAGLPDLGTLYPADDEQWRGASSIGLLRDVAQRVHAAGWWVGNVDVVVNTEQPRLAPHVDAMARNKDVGVPEEKYAFARVWAHHATLGADDLFAYLCAHGAYHAWFRLKWLADIGALLAAEPMGEGIQVRVKPKRGEGLGAIGRSEGIAVWAVALLDRG